MSLGMGQILLILLVVFVIFGAGKLPQVMADLGKGLRAFKQGMHEDDIAARDNAQAEKTKELL